jgi:proteasome lid subunit RPN8/RPN11
MDSIFHHAEQCAPRECCGLVVEENNNKIYIPLENISEEKDRFEMDAKTFVTYQLKSNIKYVVHSHYEQNSHPSDHDKHNCKAIGIPYLIVSYPDKEYTILQP